MKPLKKETYIVDKRGKKKAVIINMTEYKKLLDRLEDLEDVKYVKEHIAEDSIPYETVRKKIFRKKK
ncbi:MAG TPA: hypothetical protein VGB26_02425 [Nitrospiria bacterium]